MASRKCPLCGKLHETVLENTKTGEVLEQIEMCRSCYIESNFTYKPVTKKIWLDEDDFHGL